MKRIHLPLLSGAFILILSSFLSTTQAAEPFFNEKDFTGWSANEMSFWSVRNGEIVGTNGDQRVPGNQFLWYDEKVKNFHLSLQVKQVPFAGSRGNGSSSAKSFLLIAFVQRLDEPFRRQGKQFVQFGLLHA